MESKLNKIEIWDKETGEELDIVAIESIQREEYLKHKKYLMYNLEHNPKILTSGEIEEAVKLLALSNKKKACMIKEYDLFDKYYTANKNKLSWALKYISDSAFKCFNILIADYTTCENTIQFKNSVNVVKDKDFSRILEISPSKWTKIKNELIKFNWIKKVDFDGKKLYKINPMVIGHSMKITKCTYYAFREEFKHEFSSIKIIYWDKKLIEEFGKDVFVVK